MNPITRDDSAPRPQQRLSAVQQIGPRAAATGLVVAMATGSLSMWTIVPVSWLWLASNVVESNLFSYMFALVACPVSMVLIARLLYGAERRYHELRHRTRGAADHTGWLRSISGEGRSRRSLTLLDYMMIGSVICAIVTMVLYYFVFSHPLVVTGPEAPGDEHDLSR